MFLIRCAHLGRLCEDLSLAVTASRFAWRQVYTSSCVAGVESNGNDARVLVGLKISRPK